MRDRSLDREFFKKIISSAFYLYKPYYGKDEVFVFDTINSLFADEEKTPQEVFNSFDNLKKQNLERELNNLRSRLLQFMRNYPDDDHIIVFDLLLLFAYCFPRNQLNPANILISSDGLPIPKENYFVAVSGHWFLKEGEGGIKQRIAEEKKNPNNPITDQPLHPREIAIIRESAFLPSRPAPVSYRTENDIANRTTVALLLIGLILLAGVIAIPFFPGAPLLLVGLLAPVSSMLASMASISAAATMATGIGLGLAMTLGSILLGRGVASTFSWAKNAWQDFRYNQRVKAIRPDEAKKRIQDYTEKFSALSPLTRKFEDNPPEYTDAPLAENSSSPAPPTQAKVLSLFMEEKKSPVSQASVPIASAPIASAPPLPGSLEQKRAEARKRYRPKQYTDPAHVSNKKLS